MGTEIDFVTDVKMSDQVRRELQLTSDMGDRVLVELAAEVDRLEGFATEQNARFSTQVSASARRAAVLVQLSEQLEQRRRRQGEDGPLRLIARVYRHLRVVLDEVELPSEQRELVLQGLAQRLTEDTDVVRK
jgi:hypothetical protein